jgi:hypothetical protein
MALKRIFNMRYAGGSKFSIYDVTETIRLEEGGSGVEITTIDAGSSWTSTNEIFVGIFIGNTLIAGGAAASIGGGNGWWFGTDEAGDLQITNTFILNSQTTYRYYADIPEATPTSITVTGNLVESVKVNNGTAQSVPYTFDLNAGSNTMVIEGAARLEQLAIEGDYDSVTYGSSSYPKPADITLDPATSVLTVVNPVKEITVKYTDTDEPTVTVTTNM